ncbi:MAG: MarR family transcriptional regulator [Alphaproteobacteria bacterium]|nr:MarR family transcriptional regulator [Alphaproteobacteria bacterium]
MSEDTVGFLLSDAARLVRRSFDARARATGVTKAQWQVLLVLSRSEGINQAGLADRLEVENITLCRMVDRLQDAGLVERRPDPADRRAWRLFLTPAAHPMIASMRGLGSEVIGEALAGFSADEQAQLRTMLERVRSNLSTRSPEAARG